MFIEYLLCGWEGRIFVFNFMAYSVMRQKSKLIVIKCLVKVAIKGVELDQQI